MFLYLVQTLHQIFANTTRRNSSWMYALDLWHLSKTPSPTCIHKTCDSELYRLFFRMIEVFHFDSPARPADAPRWGVSHELSYGPSIPPLDIIASSPLVSAHRQSLPEPPLSHAKTKTDDCRTSKSDCSLSKIQFWQCSNHSTCRSCRKLQNTPWHGKIRCAHRRIHVKHPEMLTAQLFHPVHTSLELSSSPKSIWAVFETQHNLKSPKHRLTQCYAVCTRNWQPGMLTAQLSSLKSLVSTSFHGPKFSKASYAFCPTKL